MAPLSSRRLRVAAGVGALALTASVLGGAVALTGSSSADAAPGNPGTPSAGTTVYAEDFQNVPDSDTVQGLEDYTGATGQKYTADDAWLTNCNGLIASQSQSPTNADAVAACVNASNGANGQLNWNSTQQLSYALGVHTGQSAAEAQGNYADSAYTAASPGAGLTEFQTATNIPFQASDRFITFSVDVAAINCASAAHPLLQFQLLNSLGAASDVGDQIDACTSTKTVDVPTFGAATARPVNVGTYASNGAQLFTGNSIGVRMINNQGSGNGNDHAIDNIKILDVTPQLDKSFSPALTRTGTTSTLTFTVTNTSELASKSGWSFTDDLPAGLAVAPGATGGTCDATTTASGSNISITNGNLDAGEASCTITVPVTAAAAGTYDNCPTVNVTTVGLNQPACASVTFADPSFTVTKTSDKQVAAHGDGITYTLVVTNTGDVAYTDDAPAALTDDLSDVLDDATYDDDATEGATVDRDTLAWSGALAVGQTKTITYSVTVNATKTGDDVIANRVTGGTNCTTADPCEVTTLVHSFTFAKTSDRVVTTPGGTVEYTVTVTNTGTAPYTAGAPASFQDDMSGVLDDATYNGDASEGATLTGQTLSWSGPLAVGQSKDITYSVTVDDPVSGDGTLVNAVTTDDPTGSCTSDGSCTTTTNVGTYTVTKSVDKTAAAEGDTVTWTVTVRNTGTAAYTTDSPATFTDDMSDVLDDATYNQDATNGATFAGKTLSWSGPLAVGQTLAVTYSATVDTPDTGDRNLHNVVTSDGCRTATSCATDTPIDPAPPAASGGTPPGLAFTGTELVVPGAALALLLLALGGAGLYQGRRSRRAAGSERA